MIIEPDYRSPPCIRATGAGLTVTKPESKESLSRT